MAVLGKGNAHGACSLLHAAALGYGANIALDLPITVRLLDRPSKREVHDNDGVLKALLQAWIEAGHSLPEGYQAEELHWGVVSKIPRKQGLKSSAATCIAGLRALCAATDQAVIKSAASAASMNTKIQGSRGAHGQRLGRRLAARLPQIPGFWSSGRLR